MLHRNVLGNDMESPSRPSLIVFWGSLEQDAPPRTAHESSADYEARKKVWLDLRMADNAQLFKFAAKSIGMQYGIVPSFMAKPWGNVRRFSC